jgi:TolB-like protein/Tfp pilus assembly protein PilF/tRNA A-37 threonylcarbamoyl transferase component Bud32
MVGRTVSRYRVEEKLGGGGMGVVYRGEDVLLKRQVALKFLPLEVADDEEVKQRFIREARAASALDHPHVGSVLDITETEEGRLFIVMPFYNGETLKKKLAAGPLSVREAVDYTVQIAEGLACAHGAGITHRDLKPANVMVTEDGNVKIVDFGLAKLDAGLELTRTGTTLGTANYMSPEQASGAPVSTRSDLWSLGIVFYEMLTGLRPFDSQYEQAVLYAVVHRDPPPIVERRADLPEQIIHIVDRLLQKNPDRRFASANELLDAMRKARAAIGIDVEISHNERSDATAKRSIALYLVAAIFAALVLLAAYVMLTQPPPTDGIHALAVLPLANLSGDAEQEYLADGMTDALIAQLAQIKRLKVISRQSVMRYKGSDAPLQEIAKRLGVDGVMEGTVLSADGRVRVTAQLIDGRTDEHLWADSYERELEDVLTLQREIALAVAREIDLQVSADERGRLTSSARVNPTAYKLYLQGRELRLKQDEKSTQAAIRYLERSVSHDSTYAPAYAELALAYGWDDERTEDALERALTLDPNHPDVLLAYGWSQTDLTVTERIFRRALGVDPGHSLIRRELGWILLWRGRLQAAMREMRQALELDPLSPHAHHSMAAAHFYHGDYDLAKEEIEECLQLDPSYFLCHFDAYETAIQTGDYDQAIESKNILTTYPDSPISPEFLEFRTRLLLAFSETEKTDILEEADELGRRGTSHVEVARLHAAAGRPKAALERLERGEGDSLAEMHLFGPLRLHPDFNQLQGDPRFEALLGRFDQNRFGL